MLPASTLPISPLGQDPNTPPTTPGLPPGNHTNPLDQLIEAHATSGRGSARGVAAKTVTSHAPKVNTSPVPSRDDQEIVSDILSLFRQARSYRRPLVPQWKMNYRMLYNRFWANQRASWMPTPEVPEIFPIAAAIVGWMTDQRINHTIAPSSVPNSEFHQYFQQMAMDLEAVMDATWQANCEEGEWTKILWDGVTYGTGIGKTTWDLTLAGGMGDAITRRVSPFTFYPDPQATNFEDANYFIEVRTMSVQELDRRFPGAGDLFEDGGGSLFSDVDAAPNQIDQTSNTQPPRANPGAISPVTSPRYGRPGGARVHATDLPGVTVFEAWVREHETYTSTDISTGEKSTKVYDTWRVIVVAGNHVLMNEPAENLWSHGGHPYSRVVFWDQSEMWGYSLVQLLSSGQRVLNRVLAALQHNVELTGNPIWKDAAMGANQRTTMTNKPGERIRVNPNDAATGWLNPPQIQQGMIELMRYHLQRMEAISGLSSITKGGTPGGRPTQGVVDALQEAGFIRIRQHLRHLEYALRDAGYKKASLIVENYTTPRFTSIAGPNGDRTALALKARHFQIPTSEGAVPMKYQLLVDAGSRLHTSRSMREDREIQLYTLGAIDVTALLQGLDYPNANVVAERVQAAQQAAAAAGEGGGPPGARQRAGH